MLLLGLDLETGGSFDAPLEENFITEVGLVLFCTEKKTVVKILSEFIDAGEKIFPEAEQYTGISQDMVEKYGLKKDSEEYFRFKSELVSLFERADYIVAHNGTDFDKPLLEQSIFDLPKKTWIDTLIDVEYPDNCRNKNLTYLQAFHGFAYPGHRAVFDIMAMLRILSLYDFDRVKELAESPAVELVAKIDPPYNWKDRTEVARFNKEKDAIKSEGFRWNPDQKIWTLKVKKIQVPEKDFKFEFTIKEVENEKN